MIIMTKRQLGLLFILMGAAAAVAIAAVDFLGAGNFQGIGPAQRLALIACAASILLGISLVPMGDRPA